MSARATEWAWSQDLPPTELITLLALSEGANHQAQCWPTKGMLLSMTSLKEAELEGALRSLAAKNLLRKVAQPTGPAHIFLDLAAQLRAQAKVKKEVAPYTPSPEMSDMMDVAMKSWNALADRCDLPKVRKLTDAIKRPLAKRLEEGGLMMWQDALLAVEVSAHCRGINDRKWKASFGFLLQASKYADLINGRYGSDYEEKSHGGIRTSPTGRGDQRLDGLRSFDQNIRGHLAGGGVGGGGREDDRPEPEAPR